MSDDPDDPEGPNNVRPSVPGQRKHARRVEKLSGQNRQNRGRHFAPDAPRGGGPERALEESAEDHRRTCHDGRGFRWRTCRSRACCGRGGRSCPSCRSPGIMLVSNQKNIIVIIKLFYVNNI